MAVEFFVGTTLEIDDEYSGVVTEVTDDRIFIDSECFRGWATKEEIEAAMTDSATEPQYPSTQPQRPSSAA